MELRRLVVLLAFLIPLVAAKFFVEKQNIEITSPEKLKGKYIVAIANFGLPQYGGSMTGRVVYPTRNRQGCLPFDNVEDNFRQKPGDLPKFVLLDRGDCFFTFKVWQAQKAGASAVLVADDKEESLITMDAPDDDPMTESFIRNITIPSALVQRNTSDAIKASLKDRDMVNVNLDWREALPHPDERVEYELWTNSNDECGSKCVAQAAFISDFKASAQLLEKGRYTLFTPHYITWYCPASSMDSKECLTECINKGRYCTPDPDNDLDAGYQGRDVVVQNLRELCVFKVLKDQNAPWKWWDYVTDFKLRCRMHDKTYTSACAEDVATSLGVSLQLLRDCVGDIDADRENPLLSQEQQMQIGTDVRSSITILPTVVINQRQYRGKLDAKAVLKAICSGFKEGTDPPVCLGADINTNECQDNNAGCWKGYNQTACKDTFRGRICECPHDPTTGVNYIGDGYSTCTPSGPGRCSVNNGGCWEHTVEGQRFTACQDSYTGSGCKCPPGFSGNGFDCQDIDECAEKTACTCRGCSCKNTYGSYECSCSGNGVYVKDQDVCIGTTSTHQSPYSMGWYIAVILVVCLASVGLISYFVYKYRLRSYMDAEIRAIMAQYMPLDSNNDAARSDDPLAA